MRRILNREFIYRGLYALTLAAAGVGVIALAILLTIVQFLPGKDGEGIHEDTRESIHMVSTQTGRV